MTGHHIYLLIVASDHRCSYWISLHNAHISNSVHLFNVDVIQFLKVLLDLWLRELLISLESQYIVVDFFAGPMKDDLMLEEFVLWMLARETAVLGNLGKRGNTSRP